MAVLKKVEVEAAKTSAIVEGLEKVVQRDLGQAEEDARIVEGILNLLEAAFTDEESTRTLQEVAYWPLADARQRMRRLQEFLG